MKVILGSIVIIILGLSQNSYLPPRAKSARARKHKIKLMAMIDSRMIDFTR